MSCINNQEIDHSQGHAFLHNGEVFYSPNSSRRIVISDHPGPSSRYRFHKKEVFWKRFHDPVVDAGVLFSKFRALEALV